MENSQTISDIFDSKIKKVRIELPFYNFSNSVSKETNVFVGRKQLLKKLKELIESTTDKTGVFLVTGNRGVGKTSLINQVISKTSLQSMFSKNVKFLFILLFGIVGTQFLSDKYWLLISSIILGTIAFFFLCIFNSYKHKIPKQKIKRYVNFFTSAFKELGFLTNPHNSSSQTMIQFLKVIIVICYTHIVSIVLQITAFKVFIFYLCFVLLFMFWKFICFKLYKYTRKYYKDDRFPKKQIDNLDKFFYLAIPLMFLFFLPLLSKLYNLDFTWWNPIVFVALIILAIVVTVIVMCSKYLRKGWKYSSRLILLDEIILNPIKHYQKDHNRIYLHINFGHKLKDEKDILRLITRSLRTEYAKYYRSLRHTFIWRATAFICLFLFATFLQNVFTLDANIAKHPVLQTKTITDNSCEGCRNDSIVKKHYMPQLSMIGKIAHSVDDAIDKTVTYVCFIPNYLWEKDFSFEKCEDKNITANHYMFLLIFFALYLFFTIAFRTRLFSAFFVTHGMVKRQLKRLNNDITHSTERESQIQITGQGQSFGTRTKKSRGIADAREIEKELQDILNDIRRIPFFMCRPNVVIVFDELDKVEPETNIVNENKKTKASMFSVDATRERQTEILTILSNMKYFLTTASAKFIFIAGREIYDMYLADVSERSNHIGSIFNAVLYVPSFLTDSSHTSQSNITSLTEEFVCRHLIPYYYAVESYDLKNYREYLENEIEVFEDIKKLKREIKELQKSISEDARKTMEKKEIELQKLEQPIHKIIAILQQFIVYLAHVSKGAPKKMMQLIEAFIDVEEPDIDNKFLSVQRYQNSRLFLTFDYYDQYSIGIISYLITPIFNRLSESNIKEHSDKLLVSSLRFIDFLFKYHKHTFSWKNLEISPEMLEINRSPELKSVAAELLKYLEQTHITKLNFGLNDYKFDSLIANEIFVMTKTDEVFSALYSFSLDETLSLKEHYRDLLKRTQEEFSKDKNSVEFINAVSSLQIVLGDLHYYDDELEDAGVYFKNAVQVRRNLGNRKDEKNTMNLEQLSLYVRNTLKLGMIYEKRKQYEFAYLTYGELCKRIIRERNIDNPALSPQSQILPDTNDMLFKKMTFEGLKLLYLPFLGKLQILEKSHMGGITLNHLEQLEKEFDFLTSKINHDEAYILESDFYSRIADILYYKNADLKRRKDISILSESVREQQEQRKKTTNSSCTACYYYHKATSTLLKEKYVLTPHFLLEKSVSDIANNCNMKHCTTLARILSDWGNIFFSCDKRNGENDCYLCKKISNTKKETVDFPNECIEYVKAESKKENRDFLIEKIKTITEKKDIAFVMYAISLKAYQKAGLYKRSVMQIYKMLSLFKDYKIYNVEHIIQLGEKATHWLWYAAEDLNILEMNKRKKDFDKKPIEERVPLQNLLIDNDINRIQVLIKELKLKGLKKQYEDEKEKDKKVKNEYKKNYAGYWSVSNKSSEYNLKEKIDYINGLKKYYALHITSSYGINYSITTRIYRLRLKATVNWETYSILEKIVVEKFDQKKHHLRETGNTIKINALKDKGIRTIHWRMVFLLLPEKENKILKEMQQIFTDSFKNSTDEQETKLFILENIIAETIFCLNEIIRLSKTIGETYLFNHHFMASIHEQLSYWIIGYDAYKQLISFIDNKGNHQFINDFFSNEELQELNKLLKKSQIDNYLKNLLGEEWKEELSGYYENQQALSHYYKSIEMHNEGRAYHNTIDTMCYLKEDFNDRADHFNIAKERFKIAKSDFKKKIRESKRLYNTSGLHKEEGYF